MPGDSSAPQAPLVRTLRANYPANAAGADSEIDISEAPFDGTVTAVRLISSTAITGANTDSRTVVIVNKGQAGAGTTAVATKAFTSGVNSVADGPTAITLSVVAGATTVVQGDVLVVQSTHVGSTGLADPGGLIEIDVSRT